MAEKRDPDTDKDLKAEMRAALERKRAKSHPHEAGSANDGKIDHAARAAATQRQFRRKSG
jgi:hypothetical protein